MTTDTEKVSMTELEKLAAAVEEFNERVDKVMVSGLSAAGTGAAIGLLVSLNLETFRKIPAALRAQQGEGR